MAVPVEAVPNIAAAVNAPYAAAPPHGYPGRTSSGGTADRVGDPEGHGSDAYRSRDLVRALGLLLARPIRLGRPIDALGQFHEPKEEFVAGGIVDEVEGLPVFLRDFRPLGHLLGDLCVPPPCLRDLVAQLHRPLAPLTSERPGSVLRILLELLGCELQR